MPLVFAASLATAAHNSACKESKENSPRAWAALRVQIHFAKGNLQIMSNTVRNVFRFGAGTIPFAGFGDKLQINTDLPPRTHICYWLKKTNNGSTAAKRTQQSIVGSSVCACRRSCELCVMLHSATMERRRESGRSSLASTLPAEVRVCCRVRPRNENKEDKIGVAVDGDAVSVEYQDHAKSTKSM